MFAEKWWWLLFLIPVLLREMFLRQLPKKKRGEVRKLYWIPELAVVLAASLYCIYMGMNDPFLYFRF